MMHSQAFSPEERSRLVEASRLRPDPERAARSKMLAAMAARLATMPKGPERSLYSMRLCDAVLGAK